MTNVRTPRLLPTAILAMGALLATRAAELGGLGPRIAPAAMQGRPSLVQVSLLSSPARAAGTEQASSPAASNPGMGRARSGAAAPPPEQPQGQQAKSPVQRLPEPGPPPISAAERQLLEDLRARRLTLDAREAELATREAVLAAAERRLSARVDEALSAMQTRLEQLDRTAREREEANWTNLVRIYENMRPREAARNLRRAGDAGADRGGGAHEAARRRPDPGRHAARPRAEGHGRACRPPDPPHRRRLSEGSINPPALILRYPTCLRKEPTQWPPTRPPTS